LKGGRSLQVEALEGVLKVRWSSKDSDFKVADLKAGETTFTAVGSIRAKDTDRVKIWGKIKKHPDHGLQVKVDYMERCLPSNKEQLIDYMANSIKYVGETKAGEIAELLGNNALQEIIEKGPDILTEVKGIGKKKAEKIHKSVLENTEEQYVVKHLTPKGIDAKMAIKAYEAWGKDAINIVKTNPYRLTEICSLSFTEVDGLGMKSGLKEDSPHRLKAGITYVLGKAQGKGHCYLPESELISKTLKLLSLSHKHSSKVKTAAASMSKDNILVYKDEKFYPRRLYESEVNVAQKIAEKLSIKTTALVFRKQMEKHVMEYEKANGIVLAKEQQEAVYELHEHGILVLTGGPGTGKSSTVDLQVKVLKNVKPGAKVILLSPYGRTGQRLAEVTGEGASTIHREFKIRPGQTPKYDEFNKLDCDLLVIDETTLMDIRLSEIVFKAIDPLRTKILLVGDPDQLLSIKPGNVLPDLIKAGVPTVKLTEIHRTARESLIKTNAHRINNGKLLQIDNSGGDFHFKERNTSHEVAREMLALAKGFMDKGYSLDDIQVITPMKKGVIGVFELNKTLKNALNPPSSDKKEVFLGGNSYRVGDKCMHLTNCDTRDIYNGNIGIVHDIDTKDGEVEVTVRFGNRLISYTEAEAKEELMPAFATTVHKYIGSEVPVVIMPVSMDHKRMLNRSLLYTGMTRPRKEIGMVGSMEAVKYAVENIGDTKRFTGLADQIVKQLEIESKNPQQGAFLF